MIEITPTVELLKEINLFASFNEHELNEILRTGESKVFEAYSNVVIEGELSWGLYIILEGTVGIFKNSATAKDITYDIGQLKKGSFFGEMSLVDENPRSATVRALTECQLFFISKESFSAFLDRSGDGKNRFYERCVKILVGRLRELNDNYVISQYQLWKTALEKDKEEEVA
ncbi:MAG: cyclic nucleotide-binding domain-containing protein [Bacteriovoracia bacterium]